jgi:hypothetical protein
MKLPTPFAFSGTSSEHGRPVLAGKVMGRWVLATVLVCLLTVLAGCGNDKDKGKNKNKDRPTSGTNE